MTTPKQNDNYKFNNAKSSFNGNNVRVERVLFDKGEFYAIIINVMDREGNVRIDANTWNKLVSNGTYVKA
jgi:hypothetical protein